MVIDEPGEYRLDRDLVNDAEEHQNETCIHITADDVVFDGQGYSIEPRDGNTGILATGDDVTVRDVHFRGLGLAVSYRGVDDGLVENCETRVLAGVVLTGCEDVLVQSSIIADDFLGIRIRDCDDCRAADNRLDGNDSALNIFGGKDSSSARNLIHGPIEGIYLSGFRNRTYRDVILAPADYGVRATGTYARILETTVNGSDSGSRPLFWFEGLNRLVAVNCMALNGDEDGFLLEDSQNVRMEDCHAHDNEGHGIAFRDVDGAELIRNRAWANGGEGLSVDDASSDIQLEGNIFDD